MWDELVKSPGKSTSSIKIEGTAVYGSGNNGFWEVEARTNTCKLRTEGHVKNVLFHLRKP